MYKYLIIALVSVFIVSCKTDKRTELEKLRKQRDQLNEKIAALEKEVSSDLGPQNNKKPVNVSIEEISQKPFSHYVEVQGKLDGDENVGVFVQTQGGIVKAVYVKEGDYVKRGQPLAQLDDIILQQTIQEAQTQLTLLTDLYERQKSLWEQKIGSEVQYISAKTNKEAIEKRIATIKSQIDLCKIVAPIDGTVEEVNIRVGQMALPQLASFRVVNFSKIKVMADVSENYTANVKRGDEVLITFPDIKHEMKANIDFASKYINPTNRTFNIQCRFAADNREYRANMITVVKIRDYYNQNAICTPINIIQTDSKGSYLYVAETESGKHIAKKRPIKTGQDYNGITEITEGLKSGDKIIISGYQTLEEGQEIKF